jgi:hypothetical protein
MATYFLEFASNFAGSSALVDVEALEMLVEYAEPTVNPARWAFGATDGFR